MDMQAAPPTYAEMNTGRPPTGNPPVLGQQVPGMAGGLPSQGGLSVLQNPMAQQLQSYGRGDDSMLVHMTPAEVGGLQQLAQASGGSLTTNPHTGLPEAGWLGDLLPSIIGFGLNFIPGVGPLLAAGLTAAGTTAVTGDLGKGLMAGLGAYGGASLSGAVAPGATGTVAKAAATAMPAGTSDAFATAFKDVAAPAINTAPAAGAVNIAPKGISGLVQGFSSAAKAGLPAGTPGIIAKNAPMLAGMGLLNGVSGTQGVKDPQSGAIDNSYQGPYYAQQRNASFAPATQDLLSSSKERRYFDVDIPEVYNSQGQIVQPGSSTAPGAQIMQPMLNPNAKKGQNMYTFMPTTWKANQVQQNPNQLQQDPNQMMYGYAHGGKVHMDEGAFVMPARETAEFGNGSTEAGQKVLAGLGGLPIRGKGDGVSDSIPASIGGSTEAKVADGEVLFQRPAVERLGGGDHKRGTKKLYALMHKAEQSRKRAPRGGLNTLRAMPA